MGYTLRIAPAVWAQVDAVDDWWRAQRPTAATLFREELLAALLRLETFPGSARRYDHDPAGRARRLLLPRSRYFVYFDVEGDTVNVLALWHAARGQGPLLR